MALLNTFNPETTGLVLNRLDRLTANTSPQWGKMNAGQMLAHLNVAYEFAYDGRTMKLNGFIRWMLKTFVKNTVVSEKPYKKNTRTGPDFLISDSRDFENEKARLITYIKRVESDGVDVFEGKESISFGKLTAEQWSNQFYKHIDHHFQQFGI